ncbi:MAG: patatin-like phospholipase family protein [Firmicutes bacterium]|nr:patatin-like phospholipase family protein [Bacillota bacterium]
MTKSESGMNGQPIFKEELSPALSPRACVSPDCAPKIVLALGGGGARGFAHIGALQAFQEAGLEIWGITGTSMGALIGGIYAAGTDLHYLGRLAEYLKWEDLIDLHLPNLGLIDGANIESLICLLTKNQRIENLRLKFWAVATDLMDGSEFIFKEGPLTPAIRASISIPGVFMPVEYQGRILVDGAVVAGVPVQAARGMGGDLVIAVNVGFDHTHHQVNNIIGVMIKVMDIMGNRLDHFQTGLADLTIVPELGPIGKFSFHRARECIRIGRRAVTAALPKLRKIITQFQSKEHKTI